MTNSSCITDLLSVIFPQPLALIEALHKVVCQVYTHMILSVPTQTMLFNYVGDITMVWLNSELWTRQYEVQRLVD